jgi:hypothetical protein
MDNPHFTFYNGWVFYFWSPYNIVEDIESGELLNWWGILDVIG